jgi:hypothetical protein
MKNENDKNSDKMMLYQSENKGEIILYQPDDSIKLEVRLDDETVWLSQVQMAELFQTTRNNITIHITNIFKEGELEKFAVCKDFLHTTQHGAIVGKTQIKTAKHYNLDVIISVGYRVKSKRGTQFRQWANRVLKDYLLIVNKYECRNTKNQICMSSHYGCRHEKVA